MSSTGKQKKKPEKPTSNSPSSEEHNVALNNEDVESQLEKFDHELIWCIEQLQLGLETQNPSSKQAMEATKILKILLSAKAPMIKKRQAMRNAFGDYRKKMAEMEKKSLIALRKSTVASVQPSDLQKSKFFKKSTFSSKDNSNSLVFENVPLNTNQSGVSVECEDQSDNKVSVNSVSDLSSNFQFGFKIDSECSHDSGTASCEVINNSSSKDTQTVQTSGVFNKSDNSFRFGFVKPE